MRGNGWEVSARDFIVNHRPAAWLAGTVGLVAVVLVVLLLRVSYSRVGSAHGSPQASHPSSTPALPDFEVNPVSSSEGEATWYDVPEKSLAQRRAWPGELTAASDRLPKNAYVRVRRTDKQGDQDKTVVVRVTDNGVHNRGTLIDLDREAAEELGMVKAGQARVRVEVLALKNATTDKPVEKKNDAPIAPKASELTDQPTASEKQEKATASAKPQG